jgi:hypothetical protein
VKTDELDVLISRAKFHVFRAQDVADKIHDEDLRRCLALAREHLEAADRRATTLAEKAGV